MLWVCLSALRGNGYYTSGHFDLDPTMKHFYSLGNGLLGSLGHAECFKYENDVSHMLAFAVTRFQPIWIHKRDLGEWCFIAPFSHFMKGCQLTVCLWKTRFYPPFCPFLPFCCFNDLSVVVMCWSKSQNHNKDRNSDISSSNKRITFYHLKNKKTWIECEKKSDALNLVKWWWCLVDYSFSLVISLSAGHQ